ncbi:MAG: hypothetical protein ACJ788_28060 [Ktedonobacteraceae bacterium]|jgi:hypothetical protein
MGRVEVIGDVQNSGNSVAVEYVDRLLGKVDGMEDPAVVVMWQDD